MCNVIGFDERFILQRFIYYVFMQSTEESLLKIEAKVSSFFSIATFLLILNIKEVYRFFRDFNIQWK